MTRFTQPTTTGEAPTPPKPQHRMVYHSALNMVGLGAPFLAALFAIPILLEKAGVERLGVLSLCWALLGYFSIFDAGLSRALIKFVSERIAAGKNEELGPLVVTSLVMMLAISLIGAFVLLGAAHFLGEHMFKADDVIRAEAVTSMNWLALAIPLVILTSALRGVLEALHRFDLTNLLRVPMGLWNFLGPLTVVYYSPSLVPIIAALVVGRLVFLVLHVWFCAIAAPGLWSNRTFDRTLIRPLLTFGGWMTLSNVLAPLMMYLDRFVVGNQLGAVAVAWYSTPSEISGRCIQISDAILSVLFPTFSHLLVNDPEAARTLYRNALNSMTAVMFPVSLIIVAVAPEFLGIWLGTDFQMHSTLVLRIMMLGMFINSLSRVTNCLIQAVGRPDLIAWLLLFELPIFIASLVVGIATAGLPGAAYACLFRIVLDFVLLILIGRKVFPLGSETKQFLAITAACSIILIGVALIPSFVVRIAVTTPILAAMLVPIYRLLSNRNRTKSIPAQI